MPPAPGAATGRVWYPAARHGSPDRRNPVGGPETRRYPTGESLRKVAVRKKGQLAVAHLSCAPERLLPVSVEEVFVGSAASAGLMMVSTFCWCWRHRCQRKTTLAVLDKLRDVTLTTKQKAVGPPVLKAPMALPDDPGGLKSG
jgi:hypothetical protein